MSCIVSNRRNHVDVTPSSIQGTNVLSVWPTFAVGTPYRLWNKRAYLFNLQFTSHYWLHGHIFVSHWVIELWTNLQYSKTTLIIFNSLQKMKKIPSLSVFRLFNKSHKISFFKFTDPTMSLIIIHQIVNLSVWNLIITKIKLQPTQLYCTYVY